MKFSLNDYLPHMLDTCTRLEICPNKEFAAKIVSEYDLRGAKIVSLYKLIHNNVETVPTPDIIISAIRAYSKGKTSLIVYVGIEAYLIFLNELEQRDFYIGLRNILDDQSFNIRFIITKRFAFQPSAWNPKYQDSMSIVYFMGEETSDYSLNIRLIQNRWINQNTTVSMLEQAMAQLGDYEPYGDFLFSIKSSNNSYKSYGYVTAINSPVEALHLLYGIDYPFSEQTADLLLCECAQKSITPINLLVECFGEENITLARAPKRLMELKTDPLWEMFIWLLKSRIDSESYLMKVINEDISPDTFQQHYVINTAVHCLGEKNAHLLANERAQVLITSTTADPMIAQFVFQTIDDFRAIPFYNCGRKVELQGLILQAARIELDSGLPEIFDKANPLLGYYLSPYFDYGEKELTSYFQKLRCFRIKDTVDKNFVKKAYEAVVPARVENRDIALAKLNDGETALLIIDGLGAEYFPILMKVAQINGLSIEKSEIVSANLPTSTEFNNITWNETLLLQEIKRIDNLSHDGHTKYERCGYDENLAEALFLFQGPITTRIIEGLKKYKRVVVTGDHGSSYLAVRAYKDQLIETIDWENPDDWRYTTALSTACAPETMEPVYDPQNGCTYFVVRGYNRLPRKGGKHYALHGGASLEERLVPLIVLTANPVTKEPEKIENQIIENADFDDIL